jgi:hypothetical protein
MLLPARLREGLGVGTFYLNEPHTSVGYKDAHP